MNREHNFLFSKSYSYSKKLKRDEKQFFGRSEQISESFFTTMQFDSLRTFFFRDLLKHPHWT
ncbi:MAG: hypothetical protein MHPSP_000748, partial [Paramarteilia canceri]